jgi:predicted SprT family Zn-dependent metalloprotease
MPTATRIIGVSDHSRARVFSMIRVKQEGRCRQCHEELLEDDRVVSSAKNKKYYHAECAQKLNII